MGVMLKLSVVAVLVGVTWRYLLTGTPPLPPVIGGFNLPEYQPVADLFRKYLEDGTERGASFAVYRFGEPLVDLRGGYADSESNRPWREDTITMAWSVTKGLCSLCVAKLVDRGLLDYKAEVRQYWPEFDQNGKGNITVEMLVTHQSGLLTFGGESISICEYKDDWQKVERLMVTATPNYPPGSMLAYHVMTYGMYVDALIRRADPQHRNLSQFFSDEIAAPFGIDYYIGLPFNQYYRTARQTFPSLWANMYEFLQPAHWSVLRNIVAGPHSVLSRNAVVKEMIATEEFNDPYKLDVGLGSLMGFGAAGSLAKLYSILANGGTVGNRTLLAKSLVEEFSVPLTRSSVKDFDFYDYSKGFMVTNNTRGDLLFGHNGLGGQQANADPKNKLGFAYVTNFLWTAFDISPDHYQELERVFYDCFEQHAATQQRDN